MKARLPQSHQPKSQAEMLRQYQKMQEDMENLQADLDAREYTATAGGNMVEVTVDGKHQIKKINIKPEVVDPDDIEMLEDLIIAAANEAIKTATDTSEQEMSSITAGLNIPGLM